AMPDFHVDDLFLHRTLMSLAGRADASTLAFVVKRATRGNDGYETTLWGLRADADEPPRRLTYPGFSAGSPVLHASGDRIAFLSSRGDDGNQVHVLRLDGGEARSIAHPDAPAPASIESWSADGTRLLVRAQVPCEEDGEERDTRPGSGRPPQVATHLPYRQDGNGITVGRRI